MALQALTWRNISVVMCVYVAVVAVGIGTVILWHRGSVIVIVVGAVIVISGIVVGIVIIIVFVSASLQGDSKEQETDGE